ILSTRYLDTISRQSCSRPRAARRIYPCRRIAREIAMSQELVVITGASSGIGLAIARAFAAEGNPLLLISRHIAPLPELAGKPVRYAQADVVDYAQVETAIRTAEREHGETGCLVNNAGFADARNFLEVAPADFAREIGVDLIGVMNCTKAVIGNMSRRGSGT